MHLSLGMKIREFRHRDGRTQESLADAIGVTPQAVSRWEQGGSYPDMELLPSIANYFSVTIDELFGYSNDREKRIDAIIQQIDACNIKARSDDDWVDGCLAVLREGLAEFPQNERLLITLADTLSEAGWRRHQEWLCYDEEGFIQRRYDVHQKNTYWTEAVKICEYLVDCAHDGSIINKALHILVLLYRNFGESSKAIACAQKMPAMKQCRELMLASAASGKAEAKYIGEYLVTAARQMAQQIIYGLMSNKNHFDSDLPIRMIKGAIGLFDLVCDDGNFGPCNDDLICLYLYLSRVQWERGYHDDAFISLDQALCHARALESLTDGQEHALTAPLVSFVRYHSGKPCSIAKSLPDDWPWWHNPDYSQVELEIKADPRWAEWVRKTQE